MFVSCCMVNNLRTVFFKYAEDSAAVSHGTDQHDQVKVRILLPQFHLDVICVVLINVKNNQLPGIMCRNLPAQFAADGSASTGYQYFLSVDKFEYFLHICLDRLATEQIFDRNLLHLTDCNFTSHELIHAGKIFQFTVCFLTYIKDVSALFCCSTGNCQIDFFDLILLHTCKYIVSAADNRNTFNKAPPLISIIIDDAAYFIFNLLCPINVANKFLPRIACSNHHDAAFIAASDFLLAAQ